MPQGMREDEPKADVAGLSRADTRPLRAGLPEPESVVGEGVLTSPKGTQYRVLHTTERDADDDAGAPPPPASVRPV
jgi:hypothetical protein